MTRVKVHAFWAAALVLSMVGLFVAASRFQRHPLAEALCFVAAGWVGRSAVSAFEELRGALHVARRCPSTAVATRGSVKAQAQEWESAGRKKGSGRES